MSTPVSTPVSADGRVQRDLSVVSRTTASCRANARNGALREYSQGYRAYSRGTHRVLKGVQGVLEGYSQAYSRGYRAYSRGTRGVLTGVLKGVQGVLEGYSQGYSRARRPPAERTHRMGENAYNVNNAATASSAASLVVFVMDTMLVRQSRLGV